MCIRDSDMPKIDEQVASNLADNWPNLSTVLLHNYVCGDGGRAATNFISSLTNLKRY